MFTKGIEAQGFPIDFHPDDCVKLANHWETDMSEIQPVFLRFFLKHSCFKYKSFLLAFSVYIFFWDTVRFTMCRAYR